MSKLGVVEDTLFVPMLGKNFMLVSITRKIFI